MSEAASTFNAIETPAAATAPRGLFSWVATVDHKRIGILYMLPALLFFLAAGIDLPNTPLTPDERRALLMYLESLR